MNCAEDQSRILTKNYHICKSNAMPGTQTILSLSPAPYSVAMERALRTNAQVICARSKENVSVFRYFITST